MTEKKKKESLYTSTKQHFKRNKVKYLVGATNAIALSVLKNQVTKALNKSQRLKEQQKQEQQLQQKIEDMSQNMQQNMNNLAELQQLSPEMKEKMEKNEFIGKIILLTNKSINKNKGD